MPVAEMTMEAPPSQGYLERMIDPEFMQVLEQLRSDVANVETRLREHVDTVGTRLREHVADVETGLRAARCGSALREKTGARWRCSCGR